VTLQEVYTDTNENEGQKRRVNLLSVQILPYLRKRNPIMIQRIETRFFKVFAINTPLSLCPDVTRKGGHTGNLSRAYCTAVTSSHVPRSLPHIRSSTCINCCLDLRTTCPSLDHRSARSEHCFERRTAKSSRQTFRLCILGRVLRQCR
jgi:hypothetical protein